MGQGCYKVAKYNAQNSYNDEEQCLRPYGYKESGYQVAQ